MSAVVPCDSSTLKTFELSKKDHESRGELRKVASLWIAKAKENLASSVDDVARARCTASVIVNKVIYKKIQGMNNFRKLGVVLCCSTTDLKILGIALLLRFQIMHPSEPDKKRKFIHLRFLSTDPENFERGRGHLRVGFELLSFLFDECIREGCEGILVKPLATAESFFTKMGFVPVSLLEPVPAAAMIWRPSK